MKHEAKFLTKLSVTPLADGVNWKLVHDLRFRDQTGNEHLVRAGFVTDFASIPDLDRLGLMIELFGLGLSVLGGIWFWLGLPLVIAGFAIIWLCPALNRDDLLDAPATLHDEGYRRKRLGTTAWTMKFYWDWILFTAMRANGEPLWKCWLIWFNVAAFGWSAWWADGRKHK